MTIRRVRNQLKRQVVGELLGWMKVYSQRMRKMLLEEKRRQTRSVKWGAKQISNMARLHQRMYFEN